MKLITEQLDAHFGVGEWEQLLGGSVVHRSDVFFTGEQSLRVIDDRSGYLGVRVNSTTDFYRAKPKQSENFWMVSSLIWDGTQRDGWATVDLAIEEATDLALKYGREFIVLECVGIARAPKAVEYEDL